MADLKRLCVQPSATGGTAAVSRSAQPRTRFCKSDWTHFESVDLQTCGCLVSVAIEATERNSSAIAEPPSGAEPERSASVSKQTDHFVQPEGSTPTTLICGSIFGRRQHQPPVSCELLAKCQHQNKQHQVRTTPLLLFSLHASSSQIPGEAITVHKVRENADPFATRGSSAVVANQWEYRPRGARAWKS